MARRAFISFDDLSPALRELFPKIDAAVDLVFDVAEARAETEMRTNAPWRDRTGNARAGLMATHNKEPMQYHELVLYHSMPYGIWLEVRWSGRYAIIGPTMFRLGQELAQDVAAGINRVHKGVE